MTEHRSDLWASCLAATRSGSLFSRDAKRSAWHAENAKPQAAVETLRSASRRNGAAPRAICVVALLCLFFAAAPASAVTYGEIEVVSVAEARGNSSHGYTDYRLLVRHKGKEGKRVVTLAIPSVGYRMGRGSIDSVSRTTVIEAGKTQQVSLLVPSRPDVWGQGVAVWIDGRKQEDPVPMALASGRGGPHFGGYGPGYGYGFGGVNALLLYSQRVPEGFFTPVLPVPASGRPGIGPGMIVPPGGIAPVPPGGGAKKEAPAGAGSPKKTPPGKGAPPGKAEEKPDDKAELPPIPPGPKELDAPPDEFLTTLSGQQVRADNPVSTWARHWLAYTRYDGILVTSEDLVELANGGNETLAVLQALFQYTEAGGVLVVLGPGKVDVPASWKRSQSDDNGFTVYHCHFGRCIVTGNRDSAKWKIGHWSALQSAWNATSSPFQSGRSMSDLNTALPIVDNLGVPIKGLFTLMILFTAFVGPCNLWLLTKWKRRIWMLWTFPIASLFTCMVVFGYMIVAEGWQGHANVCGITILDEGEKRATTLGRAGFYSPLTPGDGLRISGETEMLAKGSDHSAFANSCAIDWTEGQHLSRGWVSARVPAHFTMRKSEPTRLRVAVQREGNTLVITNMLGADIKSITLADEKGQLHHAEDIPAGEKSPLKPIKGTLKRELTAHRNQLFTSSDWALATQQAPGKAASLLMPKSYLAVVSGSPFLEQGLAGARVRDNQSVVIGLMAE